MQGCVCVGHQFRVQLSSKLLVSCSYSSKNAIVVQSRARSGRQNTANWSALASNRTAAVSGPATIAQDAIVTDASDSIAKALLNAELALKSQGESRRLLTFGVSHHFLALMPLPYYFWIVYQQFLCENAQKRSVHLVLARKLVAGVCHLPPAPAQTSRARLRAQCNPAARRYQLVNAGCARDLWRRLTPSRFRRS